MMRLKTIFAVIGSFVIIIMLILIIANHTSNIGNEINNNLSNITSPNLTLNISISDIPDDNLVFPSNDYAINNINWSQYPNLQTGYVYTVYVAEPTNVIPHKFIEVQILTEVKGTENRTVIREQLSGVAFEARKIYGPNSDINIHGTKGGASAWIVSLLPDKDVIY